jgi:hypothetical protein
MVLFSLLTIIIVIGLISSLFTFKQLNRVAIIVLLLSGVLAFHAMWVGQLGEASSPCLTETSSVRLDSGVEYTSFVETAQITSVCPWIIVSFLIGCEVWFPGRGIPGSCFLADTFGGFVFLHVVTLEKPPSHRGIDRCFVSLRRTPGRPVSHLLLGSFRRVRFPAEGILGGTVSLRMNYRHRSLAGPSGDGVPHWNPRGSISFLPRGVDIPLSANSCFGTIHICHRRVDISLI